MFLVNIPDWVPAIIWLILIGVFIIVEAESLQLVSIWFALGAVAAMFTSFFLPQHFLLQVVIFIVVSVVILVTVRDFAKKKLKVGSTKTNVNALVGRHVKVTKRIEPYQYGEVRVGGTSWTAVGLREEIIDVGEIVEIVEISGVKLVVQRVNKQIE